MTIFKYSRRFIYVALLTIVFICASAIAGQSGSHVYGAVGDTFNAKITIGGEQVDCLFKVTGTSTCQVGNGNEAAWSTDDQESIYVTTFYGYSPKYYFHPALEKHSNNQIGDYYGASGKMVIPSSVSYNGTTYNVTRIATGAFYECYGISEVQLPTSITAIEPCAFAFSYGISTINIPTRCTTIGDYAFAGCSGLGGWTGGSGIKTIGHYAFYECSGLSGKLTLPSALETIGAGAFEYCSGLTEVVMGNSVTSVATGAFAYDKGLKKVTLSTSLTSLPDMMFSSCYALNELVNTSQITQIGESVFMLCKGLTSFEVPSGLKVLSDSMFEASGLESITIPSTVQKINTQCFSGCDHLTTVTFPTSGSIELGYNAFNNCTALESITLTRAVKAIDESLFSGCTALQTVKFPSASTTITEIPDETFYNCRALSNITIPGYITTVGRNAFYGCTSLNSIEFPASVTEFEGYTQNVFYNCSGLKAIVIRNTSQVVNIGSFDYPTNFSKGLANIYVPDALVADYKDARGWSDVADSIKPLSQLPSDTNVYALLKADGTLVQANSSGAAVSGGKVYTLPTSSTDAPEENKTINKLFIANGTTTIPEYAFRGCDAISEVNIPSTVTTIGDYAFYKCRGLKNVTGGRGVTSVGDKAFSECEALHGAEFFNTGNAALEPHAFDGCFNLRSAAIPADTLVVSGGVFRDCKMLSDVTLPTRTGGRIDQQAFSGCSSLKEVEFASYYWQIGDNAFSGTGFETVTLPESVGDTTSYTGIFRNCVLLKSATQKGSLTAIAESQFEGCTALESVNFTGNGITTIRDNAFYGCTALSQIDLPDTITNIYYFVFRDCKALKDVDLPSSLEHINTAFYNCTALTSLTMPASLKGSSGRKIGTQGPFGIVSNCKALTSLDMSACKELDSVAHGSFYGCYALEEVTFAKEAPLYWIYENTFMNCISLKRVNLPDGVTAIGQAAFANCQRLESIELPDGLWGIQTNTFWGCESLEEITVPKEVFYIGAGAFNHCTSLKTIVFENDMSEYKEASDGSWISGTEFEKYYGDYYDSANCSDASRYSEYWILGNCTSLEKVVYRDKKPSGGVQLQFSSNPTVYYTLSYYASATDAAAKANLQDHVTIKAGTAVSKTTAPSSRTIYDGTYHTIGTTESGAVLSPLDNSYWVLSSQALPSVISNVEVTTTETLPPECDAAIGTPAMTVAVGSPATATAVWQKYNEFLDIWTNANGTFEEDSKYRLKVTLAMPSGSDSSFADDVTLKVNNENYRNDGSFFVSETYTIKDTAPKTITEVILEPDHFTYDGREHAPAVTVKNNKGQTLTLGTDYTLGGATSSDAQGTFTLYVNGAGSYQGQRVSKQWSITRESTAYISSWSINPTSTPYTGEEITPVITLKDNTGKTLQAGTDYTVTGDKSATLPGTYKVTATGIGKYAGQSNTFTWYITGEVPATPVLKTITLTPGDSAYTGSVIAQTAVVKNSKGEVLVEGQDYTLTGTISATDSGAYTVNAEGIGDYEGQKVSATWKITREGYFKRYWGANRYDTSISIANAYKENRGVGQFDNIVIAFGGNFPDALAGGYLAKVKDCPLVTVDAAHEASVLAYMQEKVKAGGKVYILGGTGVVSAGFENKAIANGFDVERLGGGNRYETNLKILNAAGVTDEDILICSGNGFADSLSGSAVGKPIMVVNTDITADQKAYLDSLSTGHYYIIGGSGAVSAKVENQLKNYYGADSVSRVWGMSRYDTSVAVAKEFFPANVSTVTLSYGQNFPDGLSGGPLAITVDAPLILTEPVAYKTAQKYVEECGAYNVIVYGGAALIPDNIVHKIMGH